MYFIEHTMTRTAYKRNQKRNDATETFALYVAFHSVWTSLINLFKDD